MIDYPGLTSDFLPEAVTDRAILGIAPNCVISVFLAPVSSANTVVTDDKTSASTISELGKAGVEVLIAYQG